MACTATAKKITANLGLGIRRYEASEAMATDQRYVWMLEAREFCGGGKIYAEHLVTPEDLRELIRWAESALNTMRDTVEPLKQASEE